jgi:PIN domain nuclease of toxin-antitoxin system
MKILLDTSIFIWYITANEKLSKEHLIIIKDLNNEIYLSVISMGSYRKTTNWKNKFPIRSR